MDKVEAIQNSPRPRKKTGAVIFGDHGVVLKIPHFSSVVSPLTVLLNKTSRNLVQ